MEPNSIVLLTFSTQPPDRTFRIDDRHRDKNGEISRKHGNTLVSTLRRIYGPSFAAGESESAKLSDVLAKLHETSLTQLIQDHESGGLDEKVRKAALA